MNIFKANTFIPKQCEKVTQISPLQSGFINKAFFELEQDEELKVAIGALFVVGSLPEWELGIKAQLADSQLTRIKLEKKEKDIADTSFRLRQVHMSYFRGRDQSGQEGSITD